MRSLVANVIRLPLFPVILLLGGLSHGFNRLVRKAVSFADALEQWELR